MNITFKYDRAKAKNAVLWLLHQHGGSLEKMKLLKLVFFADREHLASHGRPIVGGTYVSMPHGPVPSELYDDVKAAGQSVEWMRTEGIKVIACGRPNEDNLSTSDLDALERIDRDLGHLDSYSLRSLAHKLRAWQNTYPGDGSSHPLPYEVFFDDLPERRDILEMIEEDQENDRVIAGLRR